MGRNHRIVGAGFDGDGRHDRAIVARDSRQWFILPSSDVDPATLGAQWGSNRPQMLDETVAPPPPTNVRVIPLI